MFPLQWEYSLFARCRRSTISSANCYRNSSSVRALVHLAVQYHELLNTMHTHAGGRQDALERKAGLRCYTCYRNHMFCLLITFVYLFSVMHWSALGTQHIAVSLLCLSYKQKKVSDGVIPSIYRNTLEAWSYLHNYDPFYILRHWSLERWRGYAESTWRKRNTSRREIKDQKMFWPLIEWSSPSSHLMHF